LYGLKFSLSIMGSSAVNSILLGISSPEFI
jgi:hypothetical protein